MSLHCAVSVAQPDHNRPDWSTGRLGHVADLENGFAVVSHGGEARAELPTGGPIDYFEPRVFCCKVKEIVTGLS